MLDQASVQQLLADEYHGESGKDQSGRRIQVIPVVGAELKIWQDWLDQFDVFVVWTERPNLEFVGWLPAAACEEAPIEWIEKNGRRIDYYHTIKRPFLSVMPTTFDFVACGHDAAFWNDEQRAWECFICVTCFHDAHQRERDDS